MSIGPAEVRTARTRPRSTSNPSTLTPPWNSAPLADASRASASATSTALATPSPGTWIAPWSRSVRMIGTRRRISWGPMSSAGMPHERACPSFRFSSCQRSGVVATSIPPTCWKTGSPSARSEE